jgi:hypothetical protein
MRASAKALTQTGEFSSENPIPPDETQTAEFTAAWVPLSNRHAKDRPDSEGWAFGGIFLAGDEFLATFVSLLLQTASQKLRTTSHILRNFHAVVRDISC